MSQTVLICDDAIFMRTMIGDILTQAGFQIVGEAETGVQAVDKVLDLATLPPSALEGRDGLPGLDPRVVRAVGRRDDGLFVVLDTEALLAPVLGA